MRACECARDFCVDSRLTVPSSCILPHASDGLLDVVVGSLLAVVNTGSASEPAFANGGDATVLPAGLVALLRSSPMSTTNIPGLFVDIDADGDLDFLSGLDDSSADVSYVAVDVLCWYSRQVERAHRARAL